jgi:PAS domain S-box-containing protein
MLGATACVAVQQLVRAHQGGVDARHHGWAATISAVAFAVFLGRLVQRSAALPERALLGVGLQYTLSFGLGATFLWFTPSSGKLRRRLALGLLLLLALHLTTQLFVTHEAIAHVDGFGFPYYAVRNGPLTVGLVPVAAIACVYGVRAARAASGKSSLSPRTWLLAASAIVAVGVHDTLMNFGRIRSIHLIDFAFAFIAFVTSASLSRRLRHRFAGLASAVADQTKELSLQQAALDRALDELREASGRLPVMAEGTLDAVLVHEDGRIVDANAVASKMFGAKTDVGMPLVELVVEGDRDLVRSSVLARSTAPHEVMGARSDGSLVPVEMVGRQVRFGGADLGVVVIRDITARKAHEARQLLTDRMVSLGTLAAGAAHEINNPLAYTMANIALVLKGVENGGEISSAQVALLGDAKEGCERIASIVADLSTFSRGGSDVLEPVEVEGILELSIRMADHVIRTRARVVRDYGAIAPVRANRTLLGQVFLNLLINAAQAIPVGSVELNEIRVSTCERDGRVVVTVKDTGVGITPSVLSRIFVPFFTTKAQDGTGLGLAVCHGIVTQLGGEIDVESQRGEGSTFRVLLPVFAPPPA